MALFDHFEDFVFGVINSRLRLRRPAFRWNVDAEARAGRAGGGSGNAGRKIVGGAALVGRGGRYSMMSGGRGGENDAVDGRVGRR